MSGNEVVETGVDDLVRLIKKKGKMSIPDVSKELGLPQKTIEKWVDFFVEEEKLGVEYRFTTPYVFLNEPQDKSDGQDKNNKEKAKDKSQDPEQATKKEGAPEKNSDDGTEDASKKPTHPQEKKSQDNETQEGFDSGEIISEDKLHQDNEGQEEISSLLNQGHKNQSPLNRAMNLFGEINTLLSKEKMHEAHLKYSDIKALLNTMPDDEERDFLEKKLISTGEKFLSAIKTLYSRMEFQSSKIDSLRKQGVESLRSGNFNSAKKAYSQVMEAYNSIHPIFAEHKRLIYNNVFEFYKSIVIYEYSYAYQIFKENFSQIERQLSLVRSQVTGGDVDSAYQGFKEINRIYNGLPQGFLVQKLELHNRILKLYQRIKEAYRNGTSEKVSSSEEPKEAPSAGEGKLTDAASSAQDSESHGRDITEPSQAAGSPVNETTQDASSSSFRSSEDSSGSGFSVPGSHKGSDQTPDQTSDSDKKTEENKGFLEEKIPPPPQSNKSVQGQENPADTGMQEETRKDESRETHDFQDLDPPTFTGGSTDESEHLSQEDIDSFIKEAAIFYKEKKYVEAKNILDQILENAPDNKKARDMAGKIEKIFRRDPKKMISSRISYAVSSASVGNFSEAKKNLEEILKVDPENEEAKKMLDSIKQQEI